MRIRSDRRPEKAMALTEVVMATGVIAVMAAALIGSFNFGFLIIKLVRENQRATQILIEKVETIRLYNWTQVNTPGFIPSSFSEYFDPQGGQGSKGLVFQGTMDISDVPFNTSYSANMKQITITLTWSSTAKISHTRTTTTFIAKDGVQNYVY